MNRINIWMATARRRCKEGGGSRVDREVPQSLIEILRKFIAAAEKWLSLNEPSEFRDELIALFFDITGFIRIADQYNHCYATIMENHDQDLLSNCSASIPPINCAKHGAAAEPLYCFRRP